MTHNEQIVMVLEFAKRMASSFDALGKPISMHAKLDAIGMIQNCIDQKSGTYGY